MQPKEISEQEKSKVLESLNKNLSLEKIMNYNPQIAEVQEKLSEAARKQENFKVCMVNRKTKQQRRTMNKIQKASRKANR